MSRFASKPMAFLADIHGNLSALDSVLRTLKDREISDVYVAGDLLLGGEDPLGVWQRLQGVGARCVRGLTDTALAAVDLERVEAPDGQGSSERLARFIATREAVGELTLERIRRLPERLRIPMMDGREIVMVHGSPLDPTQEITHDLTEDELLALIADDPADIVICGASHVPFRHDVEGISVVNVGSVGEAPEGQVAHFSVIQPKMSGAEIQQMWVEY